MKKLMMVSVVAVLGFAGEAAATPTGLRKILNMGCETDRNICWVDVSGAAVGPAGCSSTSLRFSPASTNGKSILSLLTGAFLAGKEVNFEVNTTTCFAEQPTFPVIGYINFI
ncbi:hypothetical protein NVS55_27780 [Myxococcus stipitatus]|uniref:hypothetical protein n=1 Tax=Myxococcus stipitatus TaxID=83455 RepID=UPI00314569F4